MAVSIDKASYIYVKKPGHLRSGEVHPEHFRMLIEVSSIHSPKIILAMEDFLVRGIPRKIACETHGVSPGYVSISLKKLQHLSCSVVMMYPYYANKYLSE
ncbi:PapB/FocB family fimbrial expression transcriptional regulator [Citrobacter portucalensis]|uniref:PapB/FocB family fimbrial expression transcriptional regulator n=1 Tax=Citrobacter portucalensis TaxID=1639133 RepID=UPI00288C4B70|nr:PapB/FocB family fimbrial expression transcriptional regulator [Citrobacter portucalensis]WNI88058.1 PapB/FocB family fimbrial expression transcriptional regulator [Citrobacter portucalensis]